MGRCRTFDVLGDGYGRGEGFSVLYLSHSSDGSIKEVAVQGSAVNQDGQSSSLTAPNGPSQTQLMLVALQECLQAPERLTFLVTHGTGTQLGDPIEVGAAVQAVRGPTGATPAPLTFCTLKSYYGHTEGAAGVAGFLAAVQASRQLNANPSLHLRLLNPYVQAAMSQRRLGGACPVQIPRQPQAAQLQDTLSGTSSFGMSGVNAHALVTSTAWQGSQNEISVQGGYLVMIRQRLWPVPLQHKLLCAISTAAAQQTATVSCVLTHPLVAPVHDFQVGSRAVIAVGAAMEFMAAAGASLSVVFTRRASTNIIFKTPIHCASDSVMNCRINLRSGCARLGSAAEAWLQQATQGTSNLMVPLHGRALCQVGYFSSPLQTQSHGSIATMAACDNQASCNNGSYTYVQAAISLLSVPYQSRLRACKAYTRDDLNCPPASTANHSKGLALLGQASTTACGLYEVDCHAEEPVLPDKAPAQSPAWELSWQPCEGEPALYCLSRVCLLISSRVCRFSSLCRLETESVPLSALNAVWNGVSRSFGHHSRVNERSAPDLCFGAEAHLLMLVQILQPRSQCLFVQNQRCLTDTALALILYRTTARVSDLQLSLMITDNHKFIGSFENVSVCETAILRGENKEFMSNQEEKLACGMEATMLVVVQDLPAPYLWKPGQAI